MAVKALFFYGTLRHVPLLERVLGRSRDQIDLVEGVLPDHAVFWVKDQPFPMIAAASGDQAQGLILRNPTDEDVARLNYYEGGFAYDLHVMQAQVTGGAVVEAEVYFPQPGLWPQGPRWSLADWERDWAALSLRTAAEAMRHFGQWDATTLVRWLPSIRRRAAAYLAAQARGVSPDHREGAGDVEVHKKTRVHEAFFAVDHLVLSHPRYDGGTTEPLDRECFYVGEAITLLPYDPLRDAVLLTEQFRPNVFANGDPSPWVIEPVAGLIDPGEDPETAARREAIEEAGVAVNQLELVSRSYSSTGSSTEFVHGYVATADFGDLGAGGGLDSEGEDIRRLIMSFDEFAEGLKTHRFRDTPLVCLGFWLMLNHNRSRGSA